MYGNLKNTCCAPLVRRLCWLCLSHFYQSFLLFQSLTHITVKKMFSFLIICSFSLPLQVNSSDTIKTIFNFMTIKKTQVITSIQTFISWLVTMNFLKFFPMSSTFKFMKVSLSDIGLFLTNSS